MNLVLGVFVLAGCAGLERASAPYAHSSAQDDAGPDRQASLAEANVPAAIESLPQAPSSKDNLEKGAELSEQFSEIAQGLTPKSTAPVTDQQPDSKEDLFVLEAVLHPAARESRTDPLGVAETVGNHLATPETIPAISAALRPSKHPDVPTLAKIDIPGNAAAPLPPEVEVPLAGSPKLARETELSHRVATPFEADEKGDDETTMQPPRIHPVDYAAPPTVSPVAVAESNSKDHEDSPAKESSSKPASENPLLSAFRDLAGDNQEIPSESLSKDDVASVPADATQAVSDVKPKPKPAPADDEPATLPGPSAQTSEVVCNSDEPLRVVNLALCKRISGYGKIEKLNDAVLSAGQTILMYAEILNFASKRSDDYFETSLTSAITLESEDGAVVIPVDFDPIIDRCESVRRDFYCHYTFRLPQALPPGSYTLRFKVKDNHRDQVGRADLQFAVGSAK